MTHREFFDALKGLGPFRIISICGPSVFESICRFDAYGIADGHLNAITDAYHWHIALARFRHLRACDERHERSGRRVLYFELREEAGAAPFLLIYLYRGKEEEFASTREAGFAALRERLAADGTVTA